MNFVKILCKSNNFSSSAKNLMYYVILNDRRE